MFERTATHLLGKTWSSFTTLERLLLTVGSAICLFISLWLARAMNVPPTPAFAGSILSTPAPILSLLVVMLSAVVCTLVGTIIAAFLRLEAGLFCTTIGLAALSIRGGSMHSVLQYAYSPAVFITLAVETLFLLAILAGCWILLHKLFPIVWSARLQATPDDSLPAPLEDRHTDIGDILFAVGVQAIVMILCEMLLLQSDAKKQVLAGLCVSAFIATLVSCQFAPLVDGVCYWLVPAIVGVIGYLFAFLSPDGYTIGETHGFLAPLARALPLDYITLGTAGSVLGFWTARKWKEESEQ